MSRIQVHFQHWQYEISSEYLTRYGSPYYSKNEAGAAIWGQMANSATCTQDAHIDLQESQVTCGNEAFPESALADPLADLRVWDEWVSGNRVFPYPGKFSRLGVTRQESKIAAPTSVGVLGEIITGLFSQAIISPQVLVRAIRHWPDFIFYLSGDLYAFVESKAFTDATVARTLKDRIPESVAKELLCDAVHQLNADPHLEVWGCFTGVVTVQPAFLLTVTTIQITPPQNVRQSRPREVLPTPVVRGLVERAISQASLRIRDDDLAALDPKATRKAQVPFFNERSKSRSEVQGMLLEAARQEIEALLAEAATKEAVESSRKQIESELKQLVHATRYSGPEVGRRFFEIKREASFCTLSKVRPYGADWIFMANLDFHQDALMRSAWSSDIKAINSPVVTIDGFDVWRCGGALFAIGPERLEGRKVVLNTALT